MSSEPTTFHRFLYGLNLGFVETQIKFRARRIRSPNSDSNLNPNPNLHCTTKGKLCKGCAYYSYVLKAKSKNLTCYGLSRTLHEELNLQIRKNGPATKQGPWCLILGYNPAFELLSF
ncbi:hypothetical protein MTR_4g065440 [Medicago truncatula]|uniref:DUF8204 domain-containing protein n=1 Tax=Medicago truncatula TaxID=3880 RepID=G7JDM6_MEDTR|nr:hypothetical protein MTR_4g065440 [Medicago truncatula]